MQFFLRISTRWSWLWSRTGNKVWKSARWLGMSGMWCIKRSIWLWSV